MFRTALRVLAGALVAGAVLGVLLTRSGDLHHSFGQLGSAGVVPIAAAVAAEAASLLAFAGVQRALLTSGGVRVGVGALFGVTLAGNALQGSLPAGAAWSSVFAFRQFRARGADAVLAAWVVLVEGVLVIMAVGALAAVGVAVAGPGVAAAGVAWLALGIVVLAVGAMVGWRVMRSRPRLQSIRGRLRAVAPPVGTWAFASALAMVTLIADCGCLVIAFVAVHEQVPWKGLLPAYGAGQLAARLPVTPGGLGLVEGGMTVALAAYGVSAASAVGPVLLYRFVSYWAVLVAGWIAIGVLARLRRKAGKDRVGQFDRA